MMTSKTLAPMIFVGSLVALAAALWRSDEAPPSVAADSLSQRGLELPILQPGDKCPSSMGDRDTIPHEDYIFGSGGVWFGSGPVYVNLAWKDTPGGAATFSLAKVPFEVDAFRAKTPWVAGPSYTGPILVRGQRLDGGKDDPILFRGSETSAYASPKSAMRMEAPNRAETSDDWSWWPTSMFLPGPGCYGLQIDTPVGTDVLIFEALM